jgi:hypothetical protein
MPDDKIQVERPLTGGPFAMMYGPLILEREISEGAFRTYALIWVLSGSNREEWWSQTNLGKIRGLDRKNVRRHIKELETSGLVDVVRETGKPCRVRVKEPAQVFGGKISSFYADVMSLVGGGARTPQVEGGAKMPQVGGTETPQVGGVEMPHKVEEGEVEEKVEEHPSEGAAPVTTPDDSVEGRDGPAPSGPDGVNEGDSARANGCADGDEGNFWADEVIFSDTGEVPKKSKSRNGSQKGRRKTGATGKAKTGGKKPPTPVWALWTYFRRTVEDKWPEMTVPIKPVGREWGNLKKMLEDYGEVEAHKIIDLAVLDWDAIKETWPRVAKGNITTFYAVFTLRSDLMAAVASGSGVVTRGNRCSAFVAKENAGKPAQSGWGDLFDQ